METSSPALSVAIGVLTVLLGLTGFGVYQAFGPPSKALDDPFDDHEDCRSRSSASSPGPRQTVLAGFVVNGCETIQRSPGVQ